MPLAAASSGFNLPDSVWRVWPSDQLRVLCPHYPLPSYVFVPLLGILTNECSQQRSGLICVQVNDFNAVSPQCPKPIGLRKIARLSADDFRDAELRDGARAHVAEHQRGVHRHTAKAQHSFAAGVVETVDLGVHNRRRGLKSAIPSGQNEPVPVWERGPDWYSVFGHTSTRLAEFSMEIIGAFHLATHLIRNRACTDRVQEGSGI